MITVYLSGGLGNQLFQWAFGEACAVRTGQPVQFDIRRCLKPSKRAVRRGLRLAELIPNLNLVQVPRLWESLVKKQALPFLPRWLEQDDLAPPDQFVPPAGGFHALGDFQSEAWFAAAIPQIRDKLQQGRSYWVENGGKNHDAPLSELIGVHVRRGDYLDLPEARLPIGSAYLHDALALLPPEMGVFLCSDDLDWAKAALAPTGRRIFTVPGGDRDDFFRLSSCCHHVISNSSFSWWSAWIDDDRQGHQVLAPIPWGGTLEGLAHGFAVRDRWLCPERWIRVARETSYSVDAPIA